MQADSKTIFPNSASPRRFGWGRVAVLAIGVTGGVLLLTDRPWHAAPPTPASAAPGPMPGIPVSVAKVEQRPATLWHEFSGRIEAVGRVQIRPRAAGAIVAVQFHEGAMVHKNDLLFTIDPAPYAAEVQRLEAQLAAAGARLSLAAKEQGRAQQLVVINATPQRDVDQRVNEFHAADAALHAAQAQLAVAQLNLGYTEVRAPIDGRIGKIEVTPGNLVPAGPTAPVLTTLVSVDPIYAGFEADEQTVTRAMVELPAGAPIDRIPVEMGTAATQGTPLHGQLQFIDNVVDPSSGTIRLRARFSNPDDRLIPGQFARLRLGQPDATPVLAIDERAIGTDQDRRTVMVVGDDNKVAYRRVELGDLVDGLRIVTAGLASGERIVVDGLQRIRPGATVAPQLVAMTAMSGGATP